MTNTLYFAIGLMFGAIAPQLLISESTVVIEFQGKQPVTITCDGRVGMQ